MNKRSRSHRVVDGHTVGALIAALIVAGCATTPRTEDARRALDLEAQAVLKRLSSSDPTLPAFLERAHAYTVFPSIGKGALGVGGAYGRGVVYERGRVIGYADVTQATLGLQIGGQSYSQILVFQDRETLERFKSGNFTFAANASAVAVKAGAAAATDFQNGTAVFTQSEAGLMAEASVGGQRFTYQPAPQ